MTKQYRQGAFGGSFTYLIGESFAVVLTRLHKALGISLRMPLYVLLAPLQYCKITQSILYKSIKEASAVCVYFTRLVCLTFCVRY